MKRIAAILLGLVFAFAGSSVNADLVIFGVTDGDISGGNPKSIILMATADIADLSDYGVGSANNGGGSDGEEFELSGSVLAGDKIIVAGNTFSETFFNDNYVGLTVFLSSAANINGDDAVELFMSGGVIDTYGDINVNGDGETWDYTDGYAVRTGGVAGAFDQANYDTQFDFFEGQDEAFHITTIANVYGFSTIPEPTTLGIVGLAGIALVARRRRG